MQALQGDDSLLNFLLQPESAGSAVSGATAGALLPTPIVPDMPSLPTTSLRQPSGSAGALQLYGAAPDSWQDYLINATPAADHAQYSSGGTASTQVDPKTLRQREKNRDAMRRFRERQKEKSRQDQSKVEELTMQLQRLQAEKDYLETENRALRDEKQSSGSGDAAGQNGHAICGRDLPQPDRCGSSPDSEDTAIGGPLPDFEPRRGWEDFDPRAAMLLHWSPFSDEPVRLTQETLKAMTSEQMQAMLSAMLSKAAPHVSQPFSSLDQAAQQVLLGLKSEMAGFCSSLMLNNPKLLYNKYKRTADPATVTKIIDELALSPVQVAALVEVNNRIMVEMQSLQDLQQQTLQELHSCLQQDVGLQRGNFCSYPASRILAIKLARCSEDLHRCCCSYGCTVFREILDPVQGVSVMKELQTQTNMWPVTMALARTYSAEKQDQQAKRVVEDSLRNMHSFHARHDLLPKALPEI